MIKNIMTRNVITIAHDASLEEAAVEMRENHVGDLVVVNPEKDVRFPIGMITDRDIVVSCVAFSAQAAKVSVADVMSPNPILVREDDNLHQVLSLMREKGVKRLPVVSAVGTLLGIISIDDILNFIAKEMSVLADVQRRQRIIETERRPAFLEQRNL